MKEVTIISETNQCTLWRWPFLFSHPLQWRHNGCDCVSDHQPQDCLLNRLFRRRSKKTPKLRWPVNSPHKWPVTRKMFQFDDVIMLFDSYPHSEALPGSGDQKRKWRSQKIAIYYFNRADVTHVKVYNYLYVLLCWIQNTESRVLSTNTCKW